MDLKLMEKMFLHSNSHLFQTFMKLYSDKNKKDNNNKVSEFHNFSMEIWDIVHSQKRKIKNVSKRLINKKRKKNR